MPYEQNDPTGGRQRPPSGGGFVRTANGEAWQYMVMPSQPSVSDAADWGERLKAARPLTIIMPSSPT